MVNDRQQFGSRGEQLARQHLTAKGYTVVCSNYRCPLGEIDLIADDGRSLVFIEVKTRHSLRFGPPCAAVTRKKQQQIARVAQYYINVHGLEKQAARFDVVGILLDDNALPKIDHIVDAFDLG